VPSTIKFGRSARIGRRAQVCRYPIAFRARASAHRTGSIWDAVLRRSAIEAAARPSRAGGLSDKRQTSTIASLAHVLDPRTSSARQVFRRLPGLFVSSGLSGTPVPQGPNITPGL
jgi:hypothetical protein